MTGGRDNAAGRGRASLFVGRARELAELRAGLDDALAGRGRLFLIVGDAGIGKTRLAREIHTVAEAAGARVRWARCWEGGGAPAFWPWIVLLRAALRECDSEPLAAALGDGAAAVAQLAPELRERLPGLPASAGASSFDSEHARFPLFDAVTTFFKRRAEVQPTVLIFDDLHAADHPSLLLLNFLVRELLDAPLLVVATSREIDAQQDPARSWLLTAIGRAGTRLPLAGWGADELGRFVAAVCDEPPPAELLGALHRVTEGNPFFVDEIVRLLVAEGAGRLPAGLAPRLPSSLRAAMRDRLRPLPGDAQRALGAAAVLGREFDLALLRDVSDMPGEALLAALGAAEGAGVVQRRAGALGRYRFAHALIREALYEDLPPAERPLWHRRAGEALERGQAADPEPYLDQIAYHFAHAAAYGAAAAVGKAVAYDVRAAQRAAALLAYEEAAEHYGRALQTHALQSAPDPLAGLDLQLALGDMQAAAWNLGAARVTFRAAAEQARRLGAPTALARAALGCAGLGFGLPRGVVDADMVALLEEALAALGPLRDTLWARLAVRLAVELHFSADVERVDALSREGVAVARRAGDAATLAYVINAWHFAVWDSTEVEERLALVDEAIALADGAGEVDMGLLARTWRLVDLSEIGDTTAWEREFEIYARLTAARRLPKYLGFTVALRGMRALWLGRFEDAVASAQEGMALGERVGDPSAFASVGIQIFVARRAQGRLAEIEPLARAWVDQLPEIPAPRCALAVLYADLERPEDARREYERLAADDFVALQRRNVLHPLLPYLADVCVYLGDTRRAAILYRALLPFSGRNMGLGPNVSFGPASHALGRLAALLEQWDDARQHFENALQEATRMHGPVWHASIAFDYAAALAARPEAHGAAHAAELALAARDTARGLGMERLLRRAEDLLARLAAAGAPAPDQRAAVASAAGGAADRRANAPPAAAGRVAGADARPTAEGPAGPARVLQFPVKGGGPRPAGRGASDGVFRREGEYWTIGTGGGVVRLRDTSGLRYIVHLLRHPGREFHALDLAALEQAAPGGELSAEQAAAQAAELGLGIGESGSAHALLDERARAAYKLQLDDLRDQLDEARGFNDHNRAALLEREIDFIARELARAIGLHGRPRPGSSRAERARLNVTRAIKSAVRRIAAGDRDLGLYFETTIRTGAFCSYSPDPRLPITWKL